MNVQHERGRCVVWLNPQATHKETIIRFPFVFFFFFFSLRMKESFSARYSLIFTLLKLKKMKKFVPRRKTEKKDLSASEEKGFRYFHFSLPFLSPFGGCFFTVRHRCDGKHNRKSQNQYLDEEQKESLPTMQKYEKAIY